MGKKSKTTIGYKYFMGIHMALSRGPLDEIVEIRVGDKEAWKGSITGNTEIYIDKPDLFGGEEKEGGVQGTLAVLMGAKAQPVHARLAAMLGGLVPAFRGVSTLFFDGLICAMSPYPKTWAIRARRSVQGWNSEAVWYPAKARVLLEGGAIHAMNPAHILYQAYTDPRMGRGLPASRLDELSWQAGADLFAAEGFGLSLKWTRSDGIDKFGQTVLDHAGASVFTSRRTGKIVLWPTRDNYDVDDLPHFTFDTGLLGIDDDDTASQVGGTNEVIVKYKDPVAKEDKQVRAKNLGAIHAAGGVTNSTSLDMFGLPTASLASRVAQRELRVNSGFIRRFKLRLDRRGADIMPGSVFTISCEQRGIKLIVLRAGSCEYGTLEDGTVTITAIQDVFGLPATSLTVAEPGGFFPPSTTPLPITVQRTTEVSYRDLAQALGNDVRDIDPHAGFLMSIAAAPSNMSQSFTLMTRVPPGPYVAKELQGAFCATGVAALALDSASTALLLIPSPLHDVKVGTAALIEDEIVRVDAIDRESNRLVIGRGCCDTVPVAHRAGTRIWFYEDAFSSDPTEYTANVSVEAKLLTRTSTGVLSEFAATAMGIKFAQRAQRPYPPGSVRVSGNESVEAVFDQFSVTWSHRNRLILADQLMDTRANGTLPEEGVQYLARLINKNTGSVLQERYSSGTSVSFGGLTYSGPVELELSAHRNGLGSWQTHRLGFNWTSTVTPSMGWASYSIPHREGGSPYAVCWSPELGLYCAVGDGTSAGSGVMTSRDGMNWDVRDSPFKGLFRSVCWSPELSIFVAISTQGVDASKVVMTSSDGITWTARQAISTGGGFVSVCWSGGLGIFVAVAMLGLNGSATKIMTSSDGITWLARPGGENCNWVSVCWSPEVQLFVATADFSRPGVGKIMTSRDGVTWTHHATPDSLRGGPTVWASGMSKFVCLDGNGFNCNTSVDGVNWEAHPIGQAGGTGNPSWQALAWSEEAGTLCAVGVNTVPAIITSVDAQEWLGSGGGGGSRYGVTWSAQHRRFCAVDIYSVQLSEEL